MYLKVDIIHHVTYKASITLGFCDFVVRNRTSENDVNRASNVLPIRNDKEVLWN